MKTSFGMKKAQHSPTQHVLRKSMVRFLCCTSRLPASAFVDRLHIQHQIRELLQSEGTVSCETGLGCIGFAMGLHQPNGGVQLRLEIVDLQICCKTGHEIMTPF